MTLVLSQKPGSPEERTFLLPKQIIEALPEAGEWEWAIADSHEELQMFGSGDHERIQGWHDRGDRVPTADLLDAMSARYGGWQLVWGTLLAYERGRPSEILAIAAFDSTYYEIEGRADILDQLETAFGWARFKR